MNGRIRESKRHHKLTCSPAGQLGFPRHSNLYSSTCMDGLPKNAFSLAAVDWAVRYTAPCLARPDALGKATLLVNKMLMREMHTHMPSLPYHLTYLTLP